MNDSSTSHAVAFIYNRTTNQMLINGWQCSIKFYFKVLSIKTKLIKISLSLSLSTKQLIGNLAKPPKSKYIISKLASYICCLLTKQMNQHCKDLLQTNKRTHTHTLQGNVPTDNVTNTKMSNQTLFILDLRVFS